MITYDNQCIKILLFQNVRLTHILVNVCFTKHPFNVRYLTENVR